MFVLAGTAVFEIEACHDTFHMDISDISDSVPLLKVFLPEKSKAFFSFVKLSQS